MNNYQLYRTNLLLGGQMKWDLILESAQTSLYVSDFHLSPISNNTPYTYNSDEYLIKNTHTDNVKQYYNQNKSNFYKEYLNTEFSHNWPILCEKDEIINCYSNIYDMGCKRSNRYNIHNKQFEFFCPLWLEHINDDIKFKIDIKNSISKEIIGSNTLILAVNDIKNEYHKKFIKYFNEHITKAGLNNGDDNIVNITFSKNEATATGLHVKSGIFKTVNLNNIIKNITSRERPLMEVDNMIINSLMDNELICKQLFNFNLCFNIEDILSAQVTKMMYGENVIVSVNVYIGNTELEKKDFFTEYDYIERYINSDNDAFKSENVLSYLKDNFCQSICHWSLFDNNDYIFNVYDGFSGIFFKDGEYYVNDHQYKNAPNTYIENYDLSQNTIGWINVYDINTWAEFYKYIKYTKKYKTEGIYIGNTNTKYINNIKYNNIQKLNNEGLYLIGLNIINIETFINIENNFNKESLLSLSENDNIYLLKPNSNENLLLLITNNINTLTYKNFTDIINNYENKDAKYTKEIDIIYNLLNSKIDPTLILLDASLLYNYANGPSNKLTEIDYIKDNNSYNYVLRYDGNIKPTFIDNVNTIYYKDYISNDKTDLKLENSVYSKYNYLNYEPLYPSLNYCAIKKLKDWNYNELPKLKVSEHNENVSIYDNNYEYSWFNESKIIILNPEIIFNEEKHVNDNKTINSIIETKLKTYYNIEDNNLSTFIKNMYDYTVNWDYSTNTSIENYTYTIKLKLN